MDSNIKYLRVHLTISLQNRRSHFERMSNPATTLQSERDERFGYLSKDLDQSLTNVVNTMHLTPHKTSITSSRYNSQNRSSNRNNV